MLSPDSRHVITVEFEGFPRHGKQLVSQAQEAADGEHHVNQEAIFGVDHQFAHLAHILTLAIDHRPGSDRLTPPRPEDSATAEKQKQYDNY